jgi:hypothetical protein
MAEDKNELDRVASELAACRPTTIRVYLSDGTNRDFRVAHKANRWPTMARMIAALPWKRCECTDGAGGTVGIVTPSVPPPPPPSALPPESREAQLLRMLRDAQQMVMTEQRDTMGRALDACFNVLDVVAQRLQSMESHYHEILNLARAAAEKLDEEKPATEDEEEKSQRAIEDTLVKAVVGRLFPGAGNGGIDPAQIDPAKLNAFLQQFAREGNAQAPPETETDGDA